MTYRHACCCAAVLLSLLLGCEPCLLDGQASKLAGDWAFAEGHEITRMRTDRTGRISIETEKPDTSVPYYTVRSDGSIDFSRTLPLPIEGLERLRKTGDRVNYGTESGESTGYVVVESSRYCRNSSKIVLVEDEPAAKRTSRISYEFNARLDGRVAAHITMCDSDNRVVETATLRRFHEPPEDAEAGVLPDAKAAAKIRRFKVASTIIQCVVLSPDGQRLFCLPCKSREFSMWDWNTGSRIRDFNGSSDMIGCIAVSPDGRYVVSGAGIDQSKHNKTENASLNVWDTNTGQRIRSLNTFDEVIALAFSRNGRLLAAVTWSDDGSLGGKQYVRWWSMESGKLVNQAPAEYANGYSSVLTFCSDDHDLVYATFAQKPFVVLNVATAQVSRTFGENVGGQFTSVCCADDDGILLTGNTDGNLYAWELKTGHEIRRIPIGSMKKHVVEDVGFSALSDRAVCSGEGRVSVVDVRTWRPLAEFPGPSNGRNVPTAATITPDGHWVIIGYSYGYVQVWKLPELPSRTRTRPEGSERKGER